MANGIDEVRRHILEYFYDVHLGREESENGRVTGLAARSAIRRRVSKDTAQTFGGNLQYLVDTGWIDYVPVPLKFASDGTWLGHYYKIGRRGVVLFEHESKFQSPSNHNHVGSVFVGSRHRVADLNSLLQDLRTRIAQSTTLAPEAQADILGDLDTVRAQLSKNAPDMGMARAAWDRVTMAITSVEATHLVNECAALLSA